MFSDLLQQLLLALLPNEPVYYIGGSEIFAPPLSREEETAALTALCAGDKSAERTLIEHNLRLVVILRGGLKIPAWGSRISSPSARSGSSRP